MPPPVTCPYPCLVTPQHWWMVGVSGSAVEFKPAGSTDTLPPPSPHPPTFYCSCSPHPPAPKQCQKPRAGRSAEKTHNSFLHTHLPQHPLLALSFFAGPSNRPGLLGPHKSQGGSGCAGSQTSPLFDWAGAGHSLSLRCELSLHNDASWTSVNVVFICDAFFSWFSFLDLAHIFSCCISCLLSGCMTSHVRGGSLVVPVHPCPNDSMAAVSAESHIPDPNLYWHTLCFYANHNVWEYWTDKPVCACVCGVGIRMGLDGVKREARRIPVVLKCGNYQH